ncbi:hypothetical protein JL52_05740 [Listeria ivanovii subsp. ivanovii]|nr:hypothetical protein JL52_05740 [Listeria ivanovii subsp. ivanovii]
MEEAKSGYSPNKMEATLFRGPKKRMRVNVVILFAMWINSHSISGGSFFVFLGMKKVIFRKWKMTLYVIILMFPGSLLA